MEMSCRLRKDFICDESISDGFLRRCREWAPYIEYSIVTKQAGDYEAEFYMQPSNPVTTENRLQYAVSVNGVPMQILDAVTDDFKIGDHQLCGARCAGSDPVPECTGATGTGNQYDQGLSGHAGLCA